MSKCKDDVNRPTTDETQLECCGIYPSDCVVTSESDPYLKIGKGEILTNVIKVISTQIKKLFQKVNALDRYYEFTASVLQTGSSNPVLLGTSSNLTSSFTFTRISAGTYDLVFSQPILVPGTVVIIPNKDLTTKILKYQVLTSNTIRIESFNMVGAIDDDLLNDDYIYIKIPK